MSQLYYHGFLIIIILVGWQALAFWVVLAVICLGVGIFGVLVS